jgi:uncharacterized RDD family membrane protein YckC
MPVNHLPGTGGARPDPVSPARIRMAFEDDLLRIETPENVAFGYPVAGIGSRFIAALIDSILIVLLQLAVFVLTLLILRSVFDLDLETISGGGAAGWIIAGLGLLSFLFLWGYYIFFELLWNGQSPGKRWAGLRVIRSDGRPVTLSESVIRNLVRLIDFLPSHGAERRVRTRFRRPWRSGVR